MRIYLDMRSLQRPLDDKAQLRIQVEAQAVLGILALCETGRLELIASEVLVFEMNANPDMVRRDFASQIVGKATHFIKTSDQLKIQAVRFVDIGIKPLDALHLASAIEAQADFCCTCDDKFLKKARSLDIRPTKVVSPLELISEIE